MVVARERMYRVRNSSDGERVSMYLPLSFWGVGIRSVILFVRMSGILLPANGDLLMDLRPNPSVEFLDVAGLNSAGWLFCHTSW